MIDAVMYGVTPRAKTRDGAKVSAREKVEHAKQCAGDLAPNLFETRFVDSRSGDVTAKAVHSKERQA